MEDACERFLKSWKGMLLFSGIFSGFYALLGYGMMVITFREEMDSTPKIFLLAKHIFGSWAPWVVASPQAALGIFFIYASYREKMQCD